MTASQVELADVQRLLSLFTQGLSGRYLHLKPTDALTGEFRPPGPTTDGMAIYLPPSVSLFERADHNLGLYRVSVLHQLGYYENGTFSFSLETARNTLPGLPRESAATSGLPSELERFFGLWPNPGLMRRLFMTLEDLRIDQAMVRRYPGIRHDLSRVLARALADRPDPPHPRINPVGALLEGLVRFTLGAEPSDLSLMDEGARLAPILRAARTLTRPDASVYDTAAAAIDCLRALAFALRESVLVEDAPPTLPMSSGATDGMPRPGSAEGDAADTLEDLPDIPDEWVDGMPVDFRGEVRPELVQRRLRSGNTGTLMQAIQTDAPQAADEGRPEPERQRRRLADETALRRAFGESQHAARSFLYDEWDYHRQAYIKGWCRLFEYRLQGDDIGFVERVRQRHATLAHQVKQQFRRIRPEAWHRVRRVSDGEEIELDGVIEAVIDRRAGHATDEHVYRRRDRALRDVSAAFLLDMSASTDFPIPDPDAVPPVEPPPPDGEFDYAFWNDREPLKPEAPKRRVIDVARESLALMAQALETLGDSYAIYGFSGYGREDVEFHVAKDFSDRLSLKAWAAMAAMQPRRSTRMGPAIRHAAAKLSLQPSRLKVLIMVSDGYPQDRDYGPDRNDDEYGIQDTARALQEAEQSGVQTFCVTVDPAGHDYLRRMCPDARYLVIDEVNALPAELGKVYRTLTA